MGIETRRQRHQRRPAKSGRHVAATEKSTFRSELVEVRGLNVLVPHEAVIGVALIVREYEDDVGRTLRYGICAG